MKITLFGLTLSSSWGNGHATPYRALLRALHRRGHDLVFYERDVEYYRHRRDFSTCDFCRLELYSFWEEARTRALRDVASSDVVVVGSYCPEGARINDDLLAVAAPLHVFYDLDTPITLANLERGDLDYLRREQLPQFDLVLSFTGGEILQQLENRWGVRRARPVYGCVDPEVHRRVAANAEFACGLSYMGTYAADRQHKVDELFLEPARRMEATGFVLAGSLYPWNWRWPENVRIFEHVAPTEHAQLYSSSRLTLNITRDGMARYGYCPSGRFFEAAACGTPIVTDTWPGLETFFTPGEELFTASAADEVVAALQTSDEVLARVARRARERTLSEHTGDQRAEAMLRYFEEAVASSQSPVASSHG
ncbi:MAG TPA: glycosyltransferase [Terriglobales bacterium]|nr:glycosyltransferase [Terriglobales bacterium]